jgi:hypothetical protein
MNNARMRMIGSGTPINQSKAPLPKPMLVSIVLALLINPGKFHRFPCRGRALNIWEEIFGMRSERRFHYSITLVVTAPNPTAVPIKAMRCNARMALIF